MQRRASVPEIVGAWLHIWTPPRDVDVPPVPWRRLLAWSALGALVCAGALALIVPAVQHAKDRAAVRERAAAAERRAAERRRILAEQRPRHAVAAALLPPAGATPARRVQARHALLARVQTDISRDATERARRGELSGRIGATACTPVPNWPPLDDLHARRGAFDCFTTTALINPSRANVGGSLAYPFRAVIDYRTFAYDWCKTNPIPGEQVLPDPRTVIQLPRRCRALAPPR